MTAVGIVVTLAAALWVQRTDDAAVRQALQVRGERAVQVVRARIDTYVAAGAGAAALLAEDVDLSPEEYDRRLSRLTADLDLTAIQALNGIRRLAPAELDAFVARERTLQPDFDPRLAPTRGAHAVLHRVYPVAGNRAALGFDVYANPDAGAAIERSLALDAPQMTDALTLQQASDRSDGLVVYVPARRDGRIVGWISVVMQGQDLLDTLAPNLAVRVRIVDLTPEGPRVVGTANGDVDAVPETYREVRDVEVYGQTWRVAVAPLRAPRNLTPWVIAATGLVLTALVALLVRIVVRSERELGRLVDERTRDLAAANARLEGTVVELARASRIKDDLVSAVSHELRTPLTVIRGFAQTLQRGVLTDTTDDWRLAVGRIDRSAVRLDRVVSGMFMTARLVNGEEHAVAEPTRVAVHARRAIDERCDPDAGVAVTGPDELTALVDPVHLEVVVGHLVGNALRYGCAPVDVEVRGVAGRVEMRVSDNGDGVRADEVEVMFDRFQQVDSGDRRRSSGVGLGLWLVRQLAHLNGGDVRYVAGERPTFVVDLPGTTPAE